MEEIKAILPRSPLDFELHHAQSTLKWLLRLKPDADEGLQIAAFGHDIDRAMTGITETYGLKDLSNLDKFKKEHAERSAGFIKEIMKKHGYSQEFIARVENIVRNHEVGGDADTNLVMDADSIAYFDGHVEKYYAKNGKQKTSDKVKWMYKRISPSAKRLVRSINLEDKEVRDLVHDAIKEIDH